jgi:4-amino-4-deoxy-L-arabinose transferase-like glycosyltransferase
MAMAGTYQTIALDHQTSVVHDLRCATTPHMRVPPRARDRRFVIGLAIIAAVGLAWRIAYVIWQRDVPVLSDGIHYHLGANYLADGDGYVNPLSMAFTGERIPDAVHPPGWEAVLGVFSFLGVRTYLGHQIVACVVGAATVVMTGLAGREAFGRRVGLVAAVLAAIYANIWLYERELLSEPAAMFWIATIIWLAYRFRHRPGLGRAIALGVAVALLALTRSEMIALGVLLVAPLVLFRREVDLRRRIVWLGAAAIACVVVIAPWAIYNSTRFERPVPLSAGLGGTMWGGNCPPTYSGPLYGYTEIACVLLARDISTDPSVADGQYRELAIDFMSDHRSEVPAVALARLGRTFGVYRPGQQMDLETDRGTHLWVIQLGAVMYWVLLPIAVYGLVIARRRKVMVYPLLVFPVSIVISVTLTIGATRYRAPAEIPLVLLAAVGIDQLARIGARRRATGHERPAPTEDPIGAAAP